MRWLVIHTMVFSYNHQPGFHGPLTIFETSGVLTSYQEARPGCHTLPVCVLKKLHQWEIPHTESYVIYREGMELENICW